jgi:predicted TPR repeat methyltransferase
MSEARYTDGTYLEANPGWHEDDSPMKARWIDAILRRNRIDPASIAEIGCGAGGILDALQAMRPAARFTGYEISPQAYALAAKKVRPGLDFHLQDMTTSDAGRFDLLMAIDVFEHVPDYLGFLTALRERATYKLFHVPLDMSVQMLLRPGLFTHVRETLGHLHYFSKETAFDTLRECGYEVVDWNYTYWSREIPDLPLRTRIANLPRAAVAAVSADLAVRLFGGASALILTR